ncbi:MAG: Hpt domain-containing protein [Thermodesulfobacteriota bacterium]
MTDENGAQDLDSQILQRMLQDFLEEARQHLDQLNLNLIQLEEDPAAEETIQVIFRTVHSLKGSAAFAGLKQISEVARKMEEVFGSVRKGTLAVTDAVIQAMYAGVDVLTTLIDKAGSGDAAEADLSLILNSLDGLHDNQSAEAAAEPETVKTAGDDSGELLGIYKSSYDQLAALKHLIYASAHLSDPQSLAGLLSKQIQDGLAPEHNAVWLVTEEQTAAEVARDGKIVDQDQRRTLEIESSEILKCVINDQLTVWPSRSPGDFKAILPGHKSPVLFPIKARPQAFGFMVVDPEESAEVEIYQFIGQFAAMMLSNSRLHQQVEAQRKELDEMTGILFKQNAQLSALYHVELEMMNAKNPVDLFRILTAAVVNDLEAAQAAVFLLDEPAQELVGVAQSGGLEGIESLRFPLGKIAPIRQSLESGRVISCRDSAGDLRLGDNRLQDWIVISLKGRERTCGALVAVIREEDIIDPISILVNNAGILFDNLRLTGNTPR